MVSYAKRERVISPFKIVLILVVVDDGLVLTKGPCYANNVDGVLILVVVDDGLVRWYDERKTVARVS